MSRRLCVLSALGLVCLLSSCSSDQAPQGTGGMAGGGSGGGIDAAAGNGGAAGNTGGSGGRGGGAGSGGSGGSADAGPSVRYPFDAAPRPATCPPPSAPPGVPPPPVPGASPPPSGCSDASVADGLPGSDAMAVDAAAPDLRMRSDARIPDGGFSYPNPDGRLCGNAHHTLARTPAELLVVLDRSRSMEEDTSPGRTRWDDARDAVVGAVASSSNLAWGLKVFPSIGMDATTTSCAVGSGVEVAVGFGHAGVVGNALLHAGPPTSELGSGTPTEPAILAGTAYLKTVTTTMPKYMVLVTDGEPTCASPSMGFPVNPLEAALRAISAAAAAGFKTFVIGMSADDLMANLNRLADAGGMPRAAQPRYYPAENQADLTAALQAISLAVTTCVFPLVTRPLDPDFVGVSVGSMRVPRDLDGIDGWDYVNDGTAIEIYGPACEALKTGAAQNADIYFGCPE